jgi:hypothetical protein
LKLFDARTDSQTRLNEWWKPKHNLKQTQYYS